MTAEAIWPEYIGTSSWACHMNVLVRSTMPLSLKGRMFPKGIMCP